MVLSSASLIACLRVTVAFDGQPKHDVGKAERKVQPNRELRLVASSVRHALPRPHMYPSILHSTTHYASHVIVEIERLLTAKIDTSDLCATWTTSKHTGILHHVSC